MSWPLATLESLASDEARAITDGPFGSNLARQHYTSSGPRVIRLQNIGDGEFIDNPAHISQAHFQRLRAHEVLPGDLLIASLGDVLPRGCLAPKNLGPAIVKADCIRVRLAGTVDPKWVLYSLQRPAVRRWADDQRHGVGRPRLGLGVIRRIPVPVPGIEEQRRIVAILEEHLSDLDAGLSYVDSATARLVHLRRAELDRIFGLGTGPTLPLGELIADISAGKSFGSAERPAAPREWGIIKVSAMTWGEFRPDENKAVSADRVDPRFEIRAGDLLVSRANTSDYVGASVLVPAGVRSKLLLSDKSLRVLPRPDINPEWLWRALQAPGARRQMSDLATGTKESMRNISQESLKLVVVPVVDGSEQVKSTAEFAGIESAIRRQLGILASLRSRAGGLRRAVLAAAFSGRLTGHGPDTELIEELAEEESA